MRHKNKQHRTNEDLCSSKDGTVHGPETTEEQEI